MTLEHQRASAAKPPLARDRTSGRGLDVHGRLLSKAGDFVLSANDTLRTTTSGTYVLIKETRTGRGGELRIKFDMKTDAGANLATGRVYRNGVAVGTERTTNDTNYVTYSEDISGWKPKDLVQVYAKNAASTTSVRNFRLYVETADPGEIIT